MSDDIVEAVIHEAHCEAATCEGECNGRPWITEPGLYDLTEAEYHADMVVGGSLSSTGARRLITATPAHFAYEREHGRPDTDAFRFGRAAHTEVLGSGPEVVVVAGTGKDPNSWATNDAKAALIAAQEAGQTPVKPKERAVLDAMAEAIDAHPIAGPLLAREGLPEQSFIARDPESGVMCRVRIDWLPEVSGGRWLAVDYKTCGDASPTGFAESMGKYGYHQQAAFYSDALLWLGLCDDVQFVFVAQEKEPPYLVSVHPVGPRALEWGRLLNRKARDIYRDCTARGEWPGYPLEPEPLELSHWHERRLEYADDLYLTSGDLAS